MPIRATRTLLTVVLAAGIGWGILGWIGVFAGAMLGLLVDTEGV